MPRLHTLSFYYHHLTITSPVISLNIVHADGDALILNNHASHAANESFLLTLAAPVPRTPAGLTGGRHA